MHLARARCCSCMYGEGELGVRCPLARGATEINRNHGPRRPPGARTQSRPPRCGHRPSLAQPVAAAIRDAGGMHAIIVGHQSRLALSETTPLPVPTKWPMTPWHQDLAVALERRVPDRDSPEWGVQPEQSTKLHQHRMCCRSRRWRAAGPPPADPFRAGAGGDHHDLAVRLHTDPLLLELSGVAERRVLGCGHRR